MIHAFYPDEFVNGIIIKGFSESIGVYHKFFSVVGVLLVITLNRVTASVSTVIFMVLLSILLDSVESA